jgi:hypothetical protein
MFGSNQLPPSEDVTEIVREYLMGSDHLQVELLQYASSYELDGDVLHHWFKGVLWQLESWDSDENIICNLLTYALQDVDWELILTEFWERWE